MAATKKTAPTVTLKHLSANVAEGHELSKKQAEAILGSIVDIVVKHLKKGDRIRIGGLGILQVRKRAARMGRNPATGETIRIKASKKVAFRPAKELRYAIAGLPGDPVISRPKRGKKNNPLAGGDPFDLLEADLTGDVTVTRPKKGQ